MTNVGMIKKLVDFYRENEFTNLYIFGFKMNGNIWMVKTDSEVMPYIVKLAKASKGAGASIRFRPNKRDKELLLANGEGEILCTENFFNEMVENSKYNKGEIFEKLVTEYFGQTWEKDSVPFYEDGDLTVNGKAYQIKFEQATFINEAQMLRMKKNEIK